MVAPESFEAENRRNSNRNNSNQAAIEINKLTKRFGNFTAVDDLSLVVEYGEIFGLLGPNGSGKTTTINIVSGLSKPTSGQVMVLGHDIDAAYNAQKPDPVTIHINNLNLDFTNDLRRSLPAAITMFYADRTSNNGSTSPIQIHVKETDLRTQDIDLLRFELVPNLVLLLTTAGIVNAGLATAREWEDSTIKELLLAPISKTSLIVGKLLSGWLTTLLIAAVVLGVGAVSGYLRPEGPIYWFFTLVIVLLIALASAGLGVAIGAAARRFQRVTAIGIPLSIDLFFLSGGITVAAFLPTWLQTIAHFVPTFYGTHALQTAIFYSSTEGLALDLSVLAGTSLVAGTLGVLSLRRSMLE